MTKSFIFILYFICWGLVSEANQVENVQTNANIDADMQMQIIEVYREKKYIGAFDEGELRVVLLNSLNDDALLKKKKSVEAQEGF